MRTSVIKLLVLTAAMTVSIFAKADAPIPAVLTNVNVIFFGYDSINKESGEARFTAGGYRLKMFTATSTVAKALNECNDTRLIQEAFDKNISALNFVTNNQNLASVNVHYNLTNNCVYSVEVAMPAKDLQIRR